MAKKSTTLATVLAPFDGRDVIQSRIVIRKAGDGLSTALGIAPREYHTGDEVTVVMRCTVGPIKFDPIKGTETYARVHDFIAGTALVLDDEGAVADMLDEQERRIEEAQGIARLDFDSDDGDPDVGE